MKKSAIADGEEKMPASDRQGAATPGMARRGKARTGDGEVVSAASSSAIPIWPADHVERWPIERIKLYERNARKHSEQQINQIVASMRQWGWTIPALVDEKGVLIAGHGRLEAAKRIGFGTIPVMIARGWTTRQINAYRLADNQLGLNASWDLKLLSAELQGLADMTALIGFEEGELEALLRHEEQTSQYSVSEAKGRLSDRFGIPPMSVLLGTSGWWQDRKRAWIALGIQGEIGRKKNLLGMSKFIVHQGRITRQKKAKDSPARSKDQSSAPSGDAAFGEPL